MDQRPNFVTNEESSKLPVLIIDKKGTVGNALAQKLREQVLVVLISTGEVEAHKNVIHLPYHKRIPKIPDNAYSHIFVVYNGETEHLDMLTSFVEKARESKGKVFFITSLLFSSIKLFSYLHHQAFRDVQIVLYGETFGSAPDGSIVTPEVNEINFFLQQMREYGRVEIPNPGLGKLYPIYFSDVISTIVAAAFGPGSHKRIVFAFPHYPFTQISIARLLQKIDPLLKTDFKKARSKSREYYIPQDGEYFFPTYDLESKLRQVDLHRNPSRSIKAQKKTKLHLPDPDAKRRRMMLVGTLLFSLFIAPIILTFLLALAGAGFLSLSISQAETGRLDHAKQSAVLAHASLQATGELLPGLVLVQVVAPAQQAYFQDQVQIAQEVVAAELEILGALQIMQNIYEKRSLDPKNDFYRALATLKNTLITIQKMEAEERLPEVVMKKLTQYNGVLRMVEGTIDTWPALLGFEGKRTYLILFQNNMELRPGGGFIGSYGILPMQNGQMEKLQIHDIYDADGQLKQKIDPPYGLRRYLGASNWFMRDSNYELDYSRNAVQAAQFLKLETGQSVDGVIAVDTTFLRNLIAVLGQVKVLDYEEIVTPDNFYLLTQTHAEKDFFPGSTQKKDFLRSLSNALMVELFETKKFSYEKLLQETEKSIREKHLMFAFADEGIQNVFAVNGLSSSLKDGRVADKNTFLDFFSVVDANVGTNKANYYIKRSMIQQTAFDGAGGLQTTAEVSYVNSSTKDSPFGGDYKNYVRFVLPADAVLQSISFDNVQQTVVPAVVDASLYKDPSFVPPSGLEIEQTESLGKKVVGFFFIVPAGQSRTVKLNYTIANAVNLRESSFSYNLRLFKQPGVGEDPYTLFLSYPNGFKPVRNESGGTDLGGKLVFDKKFSEDMDLVVSFSKK
jgi:hypothetical protein